MSHEPECRWAAYLNDKCLTCDSIRAAYRRGYNDHARSAAHWQATHGAYHRDSNQHGEGTNP